MTSGLTEGEGVRNRTVFVKFCDDLPVALPVRMGRDGIYDTRFFMPRDGVWVAAYWRHMDRPDGGGRLSKMGGWFPTRFGRIGWQAQIGSYRASIDSAPSHWTKLLSPETAS